MFLTADGGSNMKKKFLIIIKYGDGSVMVWTCLSYNGVNELVFIETAMDTNAFIHTFWKQTFKVSTNWK